MVIANFEQGQRKKKVSDKLTQWNYGQVLRIQGLSLPTAVEIHFSLQENRGDCTNRIGVTKDGVTDVVIPDSMVENEGAYGKEYYIYAWVYLTDETSGWTEYEIILSVETRSKPEAFDTPEDAELFRDAIATVNESADRAELAEASAEAWAHGHEDYPQLDEDNAKYYADQAKKNAQQTGEDLTEAQRLAETVALAEGNVSADKEAVTKLKEQTQTAAESALLSEQNAKESETASRDAQAGAEAAEGQTKLLAQQAEADKYTVEQAKALVMELGQEVAGNKSSVEKMVNAFTLTAQQAVTDVNNAGQTQIERVEDAGTQAVNDITDAQTQGVKAVNEAGTQQVSAVTEEGATQVANVQEAAAEIVADREQIQQNKQDITDIKSDLGAYKQEVNHTVDLFYKQRVAECTSKEEVDNLFAEWWKFQYDESKYTKVDMLERWFGKVLDDDRVHGCMTPLYSKSTSMLGDLTDDSAGLVCTPSTESTAGNDPFAHLPQFWCLEVAAEKNADGSHEIFYVEHIDDTADVRSGEHLCWVLQKNTYKREWQDTEYKYLKTRCHPEPGYKRWPEGEDRTGKVHEYMAHPKYYAGIDADGAITCGTGLKPVNRTSHQTGVTRWRARGPQYSGASGSLPKFLDAMMRLKYGRKGNSGKIEGCTNYNRQYTVAVSETGVERVILTTAQAANLFVGSAVMLGIQSGTDRNTASNYSIFDGKLITAIEIVNIDGTDYSAVYVDNDGATFDTTAGSTYLSTSPYYSGWNDNVLGRDGSRYNPTSGKEPGMIQGVEFMNGSYLIVSDELWRWSRDADENYLFDCFKCYDQSKAGSSINENYEKVDVPTLVFPKDTPAWTWKYISDNAINDNVLWPEATNASGSGVGVGAGFGCGPAASGVRSAWCFGGLDSGGIAGVACRYSSNGTGIAYWYGSLGAPGSEG